MKSEEYMKEQLIKRYSFYDSRRGCPTGSPLHEVLVGHEAVIMEYLDILEMTEDELRVLCGLKPNYGRFLWK